MCYSIVYTNDLRCSVDLMYNAPLSKGQHAGGNNYAKPDVARSGLGP